jgi:hypothetical protein
LLESAGIPLAPSSLSEKQERPRARGESQVLKGHSFIFRHRVAGVLEREGFVLSKDVAKFGTNGQIAPAISGCA